MDIEVLINKYAFSFFGGHTIANTLRGALTELNAHHMSSLAFVKENSDRLQLGLIERLKEAEARIRQLEGPMTYNVSSPGPLGSIKESVANIRSTTTEGKSYHEVAQRLYQLLDDIDTAGDIAKSDDVLYRSIVERTQSKKGHFVIECDGYTVLLVDDSMLTTSVLENGESRGET